jgi:hypothetical protein
MALTTVILRLARNPGFPDGDPRQGYVIIAPLDAQGRLDVEEWRKRREDCTVVRFKPGEADDADGRLSHRGSHWFFHYDEEAEGEDEPVHRLGDHRLAIGDYVTVAERDGVERTYRVAEHAPYRRPVEVGK